MVVLANRKMAAAPRKAESYFADRGNTGAQVRGHIAADVFGKKPVTVALRLSKRFCTLAETAEGGSAIYLFELRASVLIARISDDWKSEATRKCILGVDNQAAVSARILGTSLVDLLCTVDSRGSTRWRTEYLNTKSNSADAPAGRCDLPRRPNCDASECRAPGCFTNAFESSGNLSREATLF